MAHGVEKNRTRFVAIAALVSVSAGLTLWLLLDPSGAKNEKPNEPDAAAVASIDGEALRAVVPRASSRRSRIPDASSPTSTPTDRAPVPEFVIDGLLLLAAGAATTPPQVELISEETSSFGNDLSVWATRVLEVRPPAAVATPGAGGRFEFRNLAPGSYSVRVFGKSLMPTFSDLVKLDESNPSQFVTLRVEAGTTVHGVILNKKGDGVPGAAVCLRPARGGLGTKAASVHVVSAVDGSFTAPAPSLRSVTLQVSANGYAAASKTFTPSDLSIEVVLSRGTAVVGHMRRHDGGMVEGASVMLLGRSTESQVVLLAKTGKDGRYRIDGAPLLKRRASDHLPMLLKVRARGLWILDPEESYGGDTLEVPLLDDFIDEIQLDLVMREPRRVTGRVLDFETQRPLPAVAILASPETLLDGRVATDSEGRFVAGVLAEWAQLTPRLPRYEPCDETGGPPRETPPSESVELWMCPTLEARGFVVTESGAPIRGAVVTRSEFEIPGRPQPARRGDVFESATTDASGRFAITDVPRFLGSRFAASHPEFPAGGEVVLVPSDAAVQDLRIVMRVGAVVRGLVQLPSATGAPGVRVTAYASINGQRQRGTGTDPLREATTDGDGSFVLRGLLGDVVHLGVESKSADLGFFETIPVNLLPSPPSDVVVLRLVRLETIAGEVVDERGRPVEGAAILVYPGHSMAADVCDPELDDGQIRARTNEAGRFELRGLDPDAPVDLRAGFWSSKDHSVRVLRGGSANAVRPGTRLLTIAIH